MRTDMHTHAHTRTNSPRRWIAGGKKRAHGHRSRAFCGSRCSRFFVKRRRKIDKTFAEKNERLREKKKKKKTTSDNNKIKRHNA